MQSYIGEHPIHPQVDAMPLMPDDEYARLAADIRARGVNVPIVLDQHGAVVDGRHRLRACVEFEVAPVFVSHDFDTEADVARFIYSANVLRRHLNSAQRAFLGAQMQAVLRHQAAANQTGKSLPEKVAGGDTRAIAATMTRSNPRYVDMARNSLDIDPKIVELVAAGKITTMSDVSKILDLDEKDRRAVLRVVENGRPEKNDVPPRSLVPVTPKEAMAFLRKFGKREPKFRSPKEGRDRRPVLCVSQPAINGLVQTILSCGCKGCQAFQRTALGVPIVDLRVRPGRMEIVVTFDGDAAIDVARSDE